MSGAMPNDRLQLPSALVRPIVRSVPFALAGVAGVRPLD